MPNLAMLHVERITNSDCQPSVVLAAAAEEGLISVVVCGQRADGEFCLWCSPVRNGDSLMLIERARALILEAERDSGWRPVSGGEVVPMPSKDKRP